MVKVRHQTLIIISGLIWLAIGIFLLTIGLNFILEGVQQSKLSDLASVPMLKAIMPYIGGIEEAALIIIALALFVGHMKGRHVLSKSAVRGVERIKTFPNPTYISNIYSAKYYILLGAMIGLGISIKYLGLSNDIRGAIDVAIGGALISGSMFYFRNLSYQTKQKAKE